MDIEAAAQTQDPQQRRSFFSWDPSVSYDEMSRPLHLPGITSYCLRDTSNLQSWVPDPDPASVVECSDNQSQSPDDHAEDKSVLEDLYMGIDVINIIPGKAFGDHLPIPFYDDEALAVFGNSQSSCNGDDNLQTEFDRFEEYPPQKTEGFGIGFGYGVVSLPPVSPLVDKQELVKLLVKCAEALSEGRYGLLGLMLARLEDFSSPHGGPLQRLSFYASEAFKKHSFMTGLYCHEEPPLQDSSSFCTDSSSSLAYDMACQAFYKFLPYQTFVHFTSNQAILEAIGNASHIHIIDLDVRQGFQWPSFIQSLSVRPGGPPQLLRISAIGKDLKRLKQTGRRLHEFARSMKVALSFHPVVADIRSLLDDAHAKSLLSITAQETLVINCSVVLNRLLSRSGRIHGLLGFLRKLNPVILTVMEIESNQNMPSVVGRFLQSVLLHKALFSSIDGALLKDNPDRELIEKLFVAPNIYDALMTDKENSVRYACMDSWRKFLRHSDFRDVPLSHFNQCQATLLLAWYSNESFKLQQDGSVITLAWQDTPIVSVSAWTC